MKLINDTKPVAKAALGMDALHARVRWGDTLELAVVTPTSAHFFQVSLAKLGLTKKRKRTKR